MKVKLILVMLLTVIISGCDRDRHKYAISADDRIYYVNNYEEKNGCVEFYRYKRKYKICGNYQITEMFPEHKRSIK